MNSLLLFYLKNVFYLCRWFSEGMDLISLPFEQLFQVTGWNVPCNTNKWKLVIKKAGQLKYGLKAADFKPKRTCGNESHFPSPKSLGVFYIYF